MKKLIAEYEQSENNFIADSCMNKQASKGCQVKGCNGQGNINKNYQTHYKEKYCPLNKQNQENVDTSCSNENELNALEKLQTAHLLQIREKNEYLLLKRISEKFFFYFACMKKEQ